jgi:ABC-2 type transport system permease protein
MYTKKQLIALQTLVTSEIARFLRVWIQTLMPPVITMALYFLVFGNFIGSRLSAINGFSYMQYMMPGLVIMAIIMQAYNNSVFSFFVYRFHRNVEEILVAPVPHSIILLGFVISSVVRGLLTGVLVTIVSMCFTHFAPYSVLLILLSAVMSSVLFALIGFANAIFAKRFDDVSIIPTFVLTPLIYLGGVFYSIEQLPPMWREISRFNPILYIVETFRYGFLGVAHMGVQFGFSMLAVFIVAVFMLNLHLLNKGVGIRT